MRRCAASFALAAPAALAALVGCAAESAFTRIDPGLTYGALREGKVAVLGVVKPQEVDQVRPPLIEMLETALSEERSDIALVRSDRVREALGKAPYRRILLAYEFQGAIDSAALREVADSLRGLARFVMIARVESDRLRHSARSPNDADTALVRPGFLVGVTGRDARVSVQLYDLSKRALAFGAKYVGSGETQKPIHASAASRRPRSGVAVEVLPQVSPEDQGYPEPPSLARALEEPFRSFARELPRSPP